MVTIKLSDPVQQAETHVLCDVIAIGKRRDGGTRYWCRTHRADSTAKYGIPASKCCLSDEISISNDEVQVLDLDKYLGGVALWGAAPAVYDTTKLPIERGIHVHARLTPRSDKEIDLTYQTMRIVGKHLPAEGIIIKPKDAIYYLISTIFKCATSLIACTYCCWPHLDMDYFSVHSHRRHLCTNCGRYFYDRNKGIGNPIAGVREACSTAVHNIVPALKSLTIKQSQYPGGIQIWGSNPAFLWTQFKDEEEGIHVHTFLTEYDTEPTIDETFGEVIIDDVRLDPVMVRILMAQNVLPVLKDRVQSVNCPNCDYPQFDVGEAAYTPSHVHVCSECGNSFAVRGRLRNIVANPLPTILTDLAALAPRPIQLISPSNLPR